MLWQRLASWRFWALVALTVVDGVFFVIPVVATALVVWALIAPDLLRRIARFLESLATTS
jgi:Sec-independent protein secretion pathway component TatC